MLLIIALLKKLAPGFAEQFNFFSDMHWAWAYSIYVTFALISWLQIQR